METSFSTMQLQAAICFCKEKVKETKSRVEAYLVDTNKPLDERWALYQALPSFLRNHEWVTQDFLVRSDGTFEEIYKFQDFNRYEIIDVYSFLEDYADEIAEYNDENENCISIIATKERILSKNLGSFENDW